MAGIGGQILTHVIRRGLEQYPATDEYKIQPVSPMGPPRNGHDGEISLQVPTAAVVACSIILVLTFLVVASIDYTVAHLMATLAMVESPSSTTIVESKPPAYSEEPDAPLEKAPLLETDVEVVVINHKPITAHTRTTIRHLRRVGGWTARWRGLGQFCLYYTCTNALAGLIAHLFGARHGLPHIFGFVLATILTCRLRMLWTHATISMSTKARWYKRFVPRQQCKALLLPSLVYAVAQQLVILVPIAVFALMISLRGHGIDRPEDLEHLTALQVTNLALRILAIPASAIFVGLFVLLPAATTLTRIEACLLPEDQETIVPFDRETIMGDIDLSQRGSSKKLFRAAWASFDSSTRYRLVKVYLKGALYVFVTSFLGSSICLTILYLSMREQLTAFAQNAVAQLYAM